MIPTTINICGIPYKVRFGKNDYDPTEGGNMSVYIKGFPLPNNCGACPLRLAWCRERIYMVTRPERCPLAPVPPHGRLIDADAILGKINAIISAHPDEADLYEQDAVIVRDWLRSEPTIIPAEEGE